MKILSIIFTVLYCILSLPANAQELEKECDFKFDSITGIEHCINVDVPPSQIKPEGKIFRILAKTVKLNGVGKKMGLSGVKVLISYFINEQGEVVFPSYFRGEEFIENPDEVLQIFNDSKWKPAVCNQEKVMVWQIYQLQLCF
ncbi:hypothetical protein [Flammeovirga aprica]|uniref:TonB C-terminal domain-containing protein n=1 Tax=Flammeovirga aprica JL-4 TaxID=694437 RepID=A0A7X9RZU5_9BACT|nr:hypothetical protein [Flammeovirga aprica]NME71735.1 hypothetical protein [Flammeovirga aprica JL-4]